MANKKNLFAAMWLIVFLVTIAVIMQVLAPRDYHIIADEHEWRIFYGLQMIAIIPGGLIMHTFGF